MTGISKTLLTKKIGGYTDGPKLIVKSKKKNLE